MINDRIRCEQLQTKVVDAKSASMHIKDGMTVATSGFTPSGYPKAVPLALAERAEQGDKVEITVITGLPLVMNLTEHLHDQGLW